MKANLIFIRLGGLMNLLAGMLHVTFWNAFDWTNELSKLSTVNSNIMQMINLFIIVFFIYVGLLLLLNPAKVISTFMGRHFLGMLAAMWSARLAMEFYFPAGDPVFSTILVFTTICFVYPLISSIKVKHKMDNSEHLKHSWLAHELLLDFEIEDVWELPIILNENHTIIEVQKVFTTAIDEISHSGIAGWLFQFRFFIGRIFNWDNEGAPSNRLPIGSIRERYASKHELKSDDFIAQRASQFATVYQFNNEVLAEIENDTVHAAVHYGKVPIGDHHHKVQMTVYVKPKGLLGKTYMQFIKPFRLLIVYPIMLKVIENHWQKSQQTRDAKEVALA